MSDHEFGNVSTDLKLSVVEAYLRAFTTALRSRFDELCYIDAFAGTGTRTIRHEARPGNLIDPPSEPRIERRRGSARIALDIVPHFDKLIFIDEKQSHCEALLSLANEYPGRHIEVVQGDANEALRARIDSAKWSGTRAVIFLDPYGMAVDWSTLELIRRTEAIDIWYLVSLAGLFRQAALDPAQLTETKRAAITRMLGTGEWEAAWYSREPRTDLLGTIDEAYQRTANVAVIEQFVERRLKLLFPKVLPPVRLRNEAKGLSGISCARP